MDRAAPKQRINALVGKYKYPILALLAGLGLMLLPTAPEPETVQVPEPTRAEENLEQRLEELLCRIEGAGQVRVLLTQEAGRETLYQTDTDSDGDDASSRRTDDTVLVEDSQRNEQGLVRQIREPSYRGAVILCQGADRPEVKLAIVEAVRCVTGLGADRISVQSMK